MKFQYPLSLTFIDFAVFGVIRKAFALYGFEVGEGEEAEAATAGLEVTERSTGLFVLHAQRHLRFGGVFAAAAKRHPLHQVAARSSRHNRLP